MQKYTTPELTSFGTVAQLTGVWGESISNDYLTINGAQVDSGDPGPAGNPFGVVNCDYALSGTNYTLTSTVGDVDSVTQAEYAAACNQALAAM